MIALLVVSLFAAPSHVVKDAVPTIIQLGTNDAHGSPSEYSIHFYEDRGDGVHPTSPVYAHGDIWASLQESKPVQSNKWHWFYLIVLPFLSAFAGTFAARKLRTWLSRRQLRAWEAKQAAKPPTGATVYRASSYDPKTCTWPPEPTSKNSSKETFDLDPVLIIIFGGMLAVVLVTLIEMCR